MNISSDGIGNVRVSAFDGVGAEVHGRLAVVRWSAAEVDRSYQVYVNGRLGGFTQYRGQRQMVVHLPREKVASEISVFGVDPAGAGIDFGDQLVGNVRRGRVVISFVRSQRLGLGSVLRVYGDLGSGQIDWSRALNGRGQKIWCLWQDKVGFGLNRFGESDFGYDWAGGAGFGRGGFGAGDFGVDGEIFVWVSEPLEADRYKFAAVVEDGFGRCSQAQTTDVFVDRGAEPVRSARAVGYDVQSGVVCIEIETDGRG